jgi:hypothetical protein
LFTGIQQAHQSPVSPQVHKYFELFTPQKNMNISMDGIYPL